MFPYGHVYSVPCEWVSSDVMRGRVKWSVSLINCREMDGSLAERNKRKNCSFCSHKSPGMLLFWWLQPILIGVRFL